MAKKCKKTECPAGEKWAVPYADFLSLLLALFIALYAISAQNTERVRALKEAFIVIFDATARPEATQPIISTPPQSPQTQKSKDNKEHESTNQNSPITVVTVAQLSNLIQDGGLLEQIEQGTVLKLPSDILFEPNNAKLINEDRISELSMLAELIKKMPEEVEINIRGYTDDRTPTLYPNNYELAAARAFNVMEYLVNFHVDPSKLSYTSYGEYRPIVPNINDINRSVNNRVEIFFSTSKRSVNDVTGVLDNAKK